jgi:hypothetical protein
MEGFEGHYEHLDGYTVGIDHNAKTTTRRRCSPGYPKTARSISCGGSKPRGRACRQSPGTWAPVGEECPLLVVTGDSGSGKSSFVQAGLLPALEAHYQARGLSPRWAVFRPGRAWAEEQRPRPPASWRFWTA